ncbi:MAG: hypothetical protein KatS3mg031_3044 [Chitinophagales bacterium]|nr:MAG: hypothetical protein KatS3mg031_3044 [Chitinophagales bacterium]
MRCLLPALLLLSFSLSLKGQTTLYYESFDNGMLTFDLNTSDMNSVGQTGYNKFVVNNYYAGGSGMLTCLGFPFSFTVPNTASQPAGVMGNPNSNYLHTVSNAAESNAIHNCCFLAADGICYSGENIFAKMNVDVSTVGFSNVTLSFWWLGVGGTNNYGEVYYSTNGGVNWTLLTTPIAQYKNQSVWTQTTISNPAFDNQAMLRFGFRFVNQVTASASDPGFGVDDITITGTSSVQTLTTDSVSGNPYCPGEAFEVYYTATGAFGSGNVFTAELSDAAGSFSGAVAIGNITSTSSGFIPCTIPLSTLNGSRYRVRVVSSSPALVANDNGTDLVVAAIPAVTLDAFAPVCEHDAPFAMYGGVPAGGSYLGVGVNNNIFYPQDAGIGTFNIIYTFTDFTGCSDTATNKITVNPVPEASFSGLALQYCNTDPPVNLVGAPSGGTFVGSGITGNVFNPASADTGNIIVVQYIYINEQNCADTAEQTTMVDVCSSADQKALREKLKVQTGYSEVIIDLSAFPPNDIIKLKVLDISGRLIQRHNISGGAAVKMPLEFLNAGLYFLTIETREQILIRKLLN